MAIEIIARKREMQGTGPARRLRRQGRVPGIIYGGEQGPVNIELDHKDLYLNLRNEEQVLLRAVTMHPYRPQVEHVDFQRVQKNKKLHMKVPLHFVNAEKSPGVKDQGGVVSHVVNEIDITCLPDDLPQFVEVDLGNLAVGNSIHARDLKLPNGVELSLGKAENPVVATVVVPQLITEEEEVAAVVSAAEVPTTEQAATPKEGEAGAEGKPGEKDKPAAKAGGEKPAADKADKKEKK
jgi:large subunit ribosomal protein L25